MRKRSGGPTLTDADRELLEWLRTFASTGTILTEEARILYKTVTKSWYQSTPNTDRWRRLDKLVHRARMRFIRRDAANRYGVYDDAYEKEEG
jgi:hypothetical protein